MLRGEDAEDAVVLVEEVDDLGAEVVAFVEVEEEVVAVEVDALLEVLDLAAEDEVEVLALEEDAAAGEAAAGEEVATGALYPAGWTRERVLSVSAMHASAYSTHRCRSELR